MADYGKVNLSEVEDSAPAFGYGDYHEARFATKPLGAQQTGLAYYRIRPGKEQPFSHRHDVQEELYVLLSGTARAHLDDEVVDMRPLDVIRVAAPVTRHLEAGPDGAEILAFGAPGISGKGNDAELQT
jgi:mannose-6-phosphate isomerase-like protein (cupin superfamily)